MTYYLAYGSNLNKEQMLKRCPGAKMLGKTILPKARLIFRGVADVEPCEGSEVPLGLWRINRKCEERLDAYEGVANALYRKEYLTVQIIENGSAKIVSALIYVMNRGFYGMPSPFYLDIIRQGYSDFNLDCAALTAAVLETGRECKRARGAREAWN